MLNIRFNVLPSRVFLISRTIFLSALVSFLFAACTTLGPDFETPDSDVSEEWIDIEDNNVTSEPSDVADWWKVFNDPILDSLITSAYKQNLTLQIAGLRVLEARAQLGIAKGSLYPQLQQARGGATYNSISENSANTSFGDLNYWDFDAGFDASWELDFWGKFRRGIESADAGLLANMAAYDDFLVSLLAEVANAYVIIRTFEKRIQLAEENVDLQKRSLRITEVRFQNGATTELDVQQAKTLLRNTQATIPQLKTGDRQARHALSTLLGKPPSELNNILAGVNEIPVAPSEVACRHTCRIITQTPRYSQSRIRNRIAKRINRCGKSRFIPKFFFVWLIGTQIKRWYRPYQNRQRWCR